MLDLREMMAEQHKRRGYIAVFYPPIRTYGDRLLDWVIAQAKARKKR